MNSLSILYVEDNEGLRDTISEILEGETHQVVAFPDGEQALTAWSERKFDVLMTDISLPGMSGTDLARRILATAPRQWVVLCSGYEYHEGLTVLGPNVRSLPKVFELDHLDALMSEIAASLRSAPSD